MNIEKEREAFEAWYLDKYYTKNGVKPEGNIFKKYQNMEDWVYLFDPTYRAWSAWIAAKYNEAKKLEGCVVVPKSCQWTQDAELNWWTECGEGFVFNEDPHPHNHNFKNCCFCGGLLEAARGGK